MTFSINGVTSEYLENGQWVKGSLAVRLNGRPVWGGYVPHIISSTVMDAEIWREFKTLEGEQVVVETTDYFSRNTFRTYTGIMKTVTGTQVSINMHDVTLNLLLFLGTNPLP